MVAHQESHFQPTLDMEQKLKSSNVMWQKKLKVTEVIDKPNK